MYPITQMHFPKDQKTGSTSIELALSPFYGDSDTFLRPRARRRQCGRGEVRKIGSCTAGGEAIARCGNEGGSNLVLKTTVPTITYRPIKSVRS
jgi:hypothetical protein